MYIDISHFIDFSVNISNRNRLSPEFLQFCLNHYFEMLISVISNNGGDIIKFVGDGIFIVWSPDYDENENNKFSISEYNENMRICAIKAIQCAMDLHKKLFHQELTNGYTFNIKTGIGIGDITLIVVGGYDNSYEYICLGPSILDAMQCEKKAIKSEDIIISESVYKIVRDYFFCEDLILTRSTVVGQKFYRVIKTTNLFIRQINKSTITQIKNKYDINLMVKNCTIFTQFLPHLTNFLNLSKQYEKWLKEIRILSIMFLTLNIEISDNQNQKQTCQNIIYNLQEITHNSYGTINKIILDEKGLSILLIYGLAPHSFTADSSFCVRASFEIYNYLKKNFIDCQIGIGTGLCFCGVCGNLGGRREYSVISDVVNSAISCMEIAKEINNYPKIIFDEKTRLMVTPYLKYTFYKKMIPKGYKNEQNFYLPLLEDFNKVKKNILNPFPYILTHIQNPLNEDQIDEDLIEENHNYINELYEASNNIVGRVKKNRKFLNIMKDYYNNKSNVKLMVIKGLIGCGKSLFLRKSLIGFLKDNQDLSDVYFNENEHKYPFIFSYKNTIDNILFDEGNSKNEFNGIKHYLKKIFNILFKDSNERLKLIESIKKRDCIKYILFIEKYFEVKENIRIYFNDYVIGTNDFIYDESQSQIIFFFIDMIIQYQKYISNIIRNKFNFSPTFIIPIIFIIEDMQYTDPYTFKFIKDYLYPPAEFQSNEIKNHFLIIICYRDSLYKELLPNELFTICLPKEFTVESDTIKIFHLAPLYNENKIFDLVKIAIKNYRNVEIENVSSTILKFLLDKSYGGIPFFIIKLLLSLWDTQKIYIDSTNCLMENKTLRNMIKYNDYTDLKIPFFIEKMISSIIDMNLEVDDCIILKLASILGNIFDSCKLKQLIKLENKNLFIDFKMKDRNFIYKKLKKYEELNLIEILYDLDINNKFVVAKFSIPFLREIFYQRMLYDYRCHVHYVIGKMLKLSLPEKYNKYKYLNEEFEPKILEHHLKMGETSIRSAISNYILNQEDINNIKIPNNNKLEKKKDDELNINDLKTLIIQQVCSKIESIKKNDDNDNMIKCDFIEKKSDGKLTWEKRYFVLTSNRVVYYYNENDYKDSSISPLGSFYLYNVFKIEKLNDSNKKNVFSVEVTEWIKKEEIHNKRTFYLKTKTREEMFKWIITLNICKIKAFYDKYCLGYGYINFPLYNVNKNEMLLKVKKINFEIDELNTFTSSPIPQRGRKQNYLEYQNKMNKRMSIFHPYFIFCYNENSFDDYDFQIYSIRYLMKNTKFILKYLMTYIIGVLQNNITKKLNEKEYVIENENDLEFDFYIPNHIKDILLKECQEEYEKNDDTSLNDSNIQNTSYFKERRSKGLYTNQQIHYLNKFYFPEKEFNTVIYKMGKPRNSEVFNDKDSSMSFDYISGIDEDSKGSFADQTEEKIDHDDYLKYPEYIKDPSLQSNIIELRNNSDYRSHGKYNDINDYDFHVKNNSIRSKKLFDIESEHEIVKNDFDGIKFNRNRELNRRRKKILEEYAEEIIRQNMENNQDNNDNDENEIRIITLNNDNEVNSLKLNLKLDSNSSQSQNSEDSLKKNLHNSPETNIIQNNEEEIKYISEEEILKERNMKKKRSTKRKSSVKSKKSTVRSKKSFSSISKETNNKVNNIDSNENEKQDFDFADFLRNHTQKNNNLLYNTSYMKENKDVNVSIIKKNNKKTPSENNIIFTCGNDNNDIKSEESFHQQDKIPIHFNEKQNQTFTLQKLDNSSMMHHSLHKHLSTFSLDNTSEDIAIDDNEIYVRKSTTFPFNIKQQKDTNSLEELNNLIVESSQFNDNQMNNKDNFSFSNKSNPFFTENSNIESNEENSYRSIKHLLNDKNQKETTSLINKLKNLDVSLANENDYFSNGIIFNKGNNNKSTHSDMESSSTKSNGDFFSNPNYYINNPELHNKIHVSRFFFKYKKNINNNN